MANLKITTSGHPKSGCHLLTKAVQLLGVNCGVEHLECPVTVLPSMFEDGKHVFIKRDPRNVVISWLRFHGRPATRGMFMTALSDFYQGRTLAESFARYEGWLDDPHTLVIRFEDLSTEKSELVRIAEYLNVPYLDDAWPALPGGTMSWSGKHSDYREIWTPQVERAWDQAGGGALLKRWRY